MNFGAPIFTPTHTPLGRGRPLTFSPPPPGNCPPFQPEFSQFSPRSPLHEYNVLQMPRPINNHTPPLLSSPPILPRLPTSSWGSPGHMAPPAISIRPISPLHVHAVPYDPVQNSRMSGNSPVFYPTIPQVPKPNMEQFTPECQRVAKSKDWESAFELAAIRHGIKVQEAPKTLSGNSSKCTTSKPGSNSTKNSVNTTTSNSNLNSNVISVSTVQSQTKEKVDWLPGKSNTVSTSGNSPQSKVADKLNNNVQNKSNTPSRDTCNGDNRSDSSDLYLSEDENCRFIYVSEGEFESDSNETSSPPVDRRRRRGEDSNDWLVSGSSDESSPDSSPQATSSETKLPGLDKRRKEKDNGLLMESEKMEDSVAISLPAAKTTPELGEGNIKNENLEWMDSYYTEESNPESINAGPSTPCEAEIEQFIQDTIDSVVQSLLREMPRKSGYSQRETPKANDKVPTNRHTISGSHLIQDASTLTKDNVEMQTAVQLESLTSGKSEIGLDSNNDFGNQSLPRCKQYGDQNNKDQLKMSTGLHNGTPVKSQCYNDVAKNSLLLSDIENAEELSSELNSGNGDSNDFDDDDGDDIFVKLALQKGIKVGNRLPVNNKQCVQPDRGVDFERLAAKNGIRIGLSSSPSPLKEKTKKTDCYEGMFEKFAAKNGIRIGSSEHQPKQNVSYLPQEFIPPISPIAVPDPIPITAAVFPVPCLIKAPSLQPDLELPINNQLDFTTNKRRESLTFEEKASKHGIKIGPTKADADCQTDQCILNSQASQTYVIKVQHQPVQVDVDQEAFKEEFNAWMQEELNLLDSTAASFRELYCNEVDARVEAERRLEVEMNENVKSQRTTKMQIDEMKQQLQNQEQTIEKLTKELKSTKKHKDNEIKKLTKDLKLREEEIANLGHEIHLKDVAIENINLISGDQTTKIEELQEKIKQMESEMEKERKKNSTFKVEPKKTASQPNLSTEWQVVKGRSTKTKPGTLLDSNHIDSLSGFDDIDYNKYNTLAIHSNDDINDQPQSSTHRNDQEVFSSQLRSTSFHQQSELNSSSECNLDNARLNLVTSPVNDHTELKINSSSHSSINCSSEHLSRQNSHSSLTSPRLNESSSSTEIDSVYVSPPSSSPSITTASSVPSFTKPHSIPGGFAISSVPTSASVPTSLPPIFGRIPPPNMYLPPPPPVTTAYVVSNKPDIPLPTRKIKPAKQLSGRELFDGVMDALRDQFPNFSRPLLMVYMNQAKFSYGSTGFEGKKISDIVHRVSQIIQRESIIPRT